VLLFNLHLSSRQQSPIQFPESDSALPGEYARLLFRMSSPLPPTMRNMAVPEFHLGENARGFVFNADLVSVIQFLDIGTRVDWNFTV
jgi:hypothetical protein